MLLVMQSQGVLLNETKADDKTGELMNETQGDDKKGELLNETKGNVKKGVSIWSVTWDKVDPIFPLLRQQITGQSKDKRGEGVGQDPVIQVKSKDQALT